jgi:hypothetical protein
MNASIVRWKNTHTITLVGAVLSAVIAVALWQSVMHTVAQTTPICPVSYIMGVSTGSGSTSTPVGGVLPLVFNAPTLPNTVTATSVDFYSVTAGFLGSAVKSSTGANGTYWSLPLYTQLLPNSTQIFYANVGMSDGNSCNSQQIPQQVNNPTAAKLAIQTTPPSFTGPTNTVINFSSVLSVNGATVLPYAKVDWITTSGTIEKIPLVVVAARLFTGPQTGNSTVTVTATYGGQTIKKDIPISVLGAASAGSVQLINPSTPSPLAATSSLTSTTVVSPTTIAPTALTASVQDCAVTVLGNQKAAAIKAGTIRPSADDLIKLKPCFAQTNNVVPSTFAPVAPASIKNLTKSSDVTISDLSNIKTDTKKDALKISGKSAKNSQVLVYVFSEPLVITTTSDAQGNWNYTLEDPLAPGKHEVYAVVDKGDGQYQKTDPFSFVIGSAKASAENPAGLSLKLENDPTPIQNNRKIYIYLVVFGALVVSGLITTLLLFRRWNNHNHFQPPANNVIPPSPPVTPNYGS